MSKTVNYIIVGLVILALLGVFYLGYTIYPKFNKCPQIASDTIYVRDTVWYYIPDTIPYYIVKHDTVIYHDTIPAIVDTAFILKDYYATHMYEREWKDTSIVVNMKDYISRNKPIDNVFTYKILRPQTIIHNEVNNTFYSKYITLGVDFPFKNTEGVNASLDALYVTPKFYLGAGYNGYLRCLSLKGGATIFRW